jgi:hypothetical protein
MQVTNEMVEVAADTIAEMLRSGKTGKLAIEDMARAFVAQHGSK